MKEIKFEYKFTVIYIAIGCAWIAFSDNTLEHLVNNQSTLTQLQTYKGWIFVFVTAMLFLVFLKSHLNRLRAAEKKAIDSDDIKTAFIQNISHEIRTPMNGIVGYANLLDDPNLSNAQRGEYLNTITKSSAQLLNIVNEILDISLIHSKNVKTEEHKTHLNNLLDEVFYSIKPLIKKNVFFFLRKELADSECYVLIDDMKIKQILNSLLNNAIKFTEKGDIQFGYTLKKDKLEFFVKDTGIGLSDESQKLLFNSFQKGKTDDKKIYLGLGLGLAICKGYLDILKGNIWVESEIGIGSTFYFNIPYKAVKQEDKTPIPVTNNLNNLTILVVEDEEINYLYIKEVLSDTGIHVHRAINGKEAVELCKTNFEIGLILMDIKMPIMDGFEATKKIKELRPTIPIIVQTAFASSEERERMNIAGCSDYISKPFKKEKLLKIIKRYQKVDIDTKYD